MAEVAISAAKVDKDFSIESASQVSHSFVRRTFIGETSKKSVVQSEGSGIGRNAGNQLSAFGRDVGPTSIQHEP